MSTRRRSGRLGQRPEAEAEADEQSPEPARNRASARKGAASRNKKAVIQDDDGEEEEEPEEDEQEEEDEGASREADDRAHPGGSDDDEDAEEFKMPKVNIAYTVAATNEVKKMGKEEMKRRVNALTRYILFCESRRVPLRRDDAVKKVFSGLGASASRAYPYILNKSARALRKHWGFELVEVRVRGGENTQLAALSAAETQTQAATQTQKGRKADGDDDIIDVDDEEAEGARKKKTSTPKTTNTYIIRSILPPAVIAGMTSADAGLAAVVADVNEESSGRRPADGEGVMLDWKRADGQLGQMGLLHLILALIMVHQRSLSDNTLRSFLNRLGVTSKGVLPMTLQPEGVEEREGGAETYRATQSASAAGLGTPLTLDAFLNQLVRQSYLERVRSATEPGATTQTGRRARATAGRRSNAANDDFEPGVNTDEWRWGARAEAEIGEVAVARFMSEIEAFHVERDVRREEELAQSEREAEEEGLEDGQPATATAASRRKKGKKSRASGAANDGEELFETKVAKRRQQIYERTLESVSRAAGTALIV